MTRRPSNESPRRHSPLALRRKRWLNGLRWLYRLLRQGDPSFRRSDLLRALRAFDTRFYLQCNPDVAATGIMAFDHYCRFGWKEGRDPCRGFSTRRYLADHPDVGASGLNPFLHATVHRRTAQGPAETRPARPAPAPTSAPTPAPARPARADSPVRLRDSPVVASAADPFDPSESKAWVAALTADPAFDRVRQESPLVSVILPTRDRVQILPAAVESVRAQSYGNWELLIIDDGSQDGTDRYLASLAGEPRIRVLSSGGAGVSEARNHGLRAARGTFIAYLDSDNAWLPRYLELSLAALFRSGADCVYSVLEVHDGAGAAPWYRARRFDYRKLVYANYIDINVFLHRAALSEARDGFDRALERMVDWDFIIRCARTHSVAFANVIGARYDNSRREDRITNRHTTAWQNVVRNRYLIDWPALEAALPARDPALVSIIICAYGRPDLTDACLTALLTQPAGARFEIVLVDNGSDGPAAARLRAWAERETAVTLLRNDDNLNFALGNNLGFAVSRGAQVVFLNNDTEVAPEWLGALLAPLSDPAVKGAQPKLLYPDGRLQSAGNVFSAFSPLAYPLYARQPGHFWPSQAPRSFKAVTAACLALRAADFIALRGFDPIFVNGQEDTDLCLRLGRGQPVFRSVPDSLVWHHEAQTPGRNARIADNRKIFCARWKDRPEVAADDHLYYREDRITPCDVKPDIPDWAADGYAVWRPERLEGAPVPARPAVKRSGRLIAIKIPCPRPAVRAVWGDYHFAVALVGAFMRQGVRSRIDFLESWEEAGSPGEINLVLRGLSRFEPRPGETNLAWLISHPDKVTVAELQGFDRVFVASQAWTQHLAAEGVACEALLQCTDACRFLPGPREAALHAPVLYAANSRRIYRRGLAEAVAQGITLDIYGELWDGLAPPAWVKAENIPNRDLPHYYRSAGAVLNDHWDDMQAKGFVSNRIFDVLACAAPLVTDRVEGIPEALLPACTFFDAGQPLSRALEIARGLSESERLRIADIVRREHSFDARAARILDAIERL